MSHNNVHAARRSDQDQDGGKGANFVTGKKQRNIRVSFQIRSGSRRCHRLGINKVAIDPTHGRLFSAGRDSTIINWDIGDGAQVFSKTSVLE